MKFRYTVFLFRCSKCGNSVERRGINVSDSMLCTKCKREKTNLERYGVKNNTWIPSVRKKIEKHFIEKYGSKSNLSSKKNQELVKRTMMERYGVDNPMRSKEIKERLADTNKKKYGVTNVFASGDIKKKIRETNLKKYGVENAATARSVIEKARKTNVERYGVPFTFQSESVKGKIKNTMLRKYGVDHPAKSKEIHLKQFSNKRESNGGFMSGSERKFAELLAGKKIQYEYEFFHNGHNWDFKVGDVLVEIDGEYTHGFLSDTDGKHVQGRLDYERPKLAKPYKLLLIDSMNVDDGIDELVWMIGASIDDYINKIVDSIPVEFPYPSYSDVRMKRDWEHLKSYAWNPGQWFCMSVIGNFHRSIWSVSVDGNKSPVEVWRDKDLLRKCVESRFIYKNHLSSSSIVDGFKICSFAPKVSVFNPSAAKHLVEMYLQDFDEVFDPFSGFSSVMLGTCACGKRYVGQNVSENAAEESRKIIEYLDIDAVVSCVDSTKTVGVHDCLFTRLPNLSNKTCGIGADNTTCDWLIDLCVKNYKCQKYVFVVDKTDKYADKIDFVINDNGHILTSKEHVIVIDGSKKTK